MVARIMMCLLVLAGMMGCGGARPLVRVGDEEVVESHPDPLPAWRLHTSTETAQAYQFSGVGEGIVLNLTTAQAEADALKRLIGNIEIMARREFEDTAVKAGLGEEDHSLFVRDGVGFMVDNIRVQGFRPREICYERVRSLAAPDRVTHRLRVGALTEISRPELTNAKIEAAKRLEGKARSQQKQAAAEAARGLWERLQAGRPPQ